MSLISLNASARRSIAHHSRGLSLLLVLLLIAVMAGLASLGYLQWRSQFAINSSVQERQALAQADQALLAFTTVKHRLPCPDINRDGEEDCNAVDQKGWLPSVTLRMAGADPGVTVGQLRYLVQRGGGENDLTLRTDSWRPLEYDEDAKTFFSMRPVGYAAENPSQIVTMADFCQRLEDARKTPWSDALAQVNVGGGRPVAYALAHPGNGSADGESDLFDGANSMASSTNRLEDPDRRPQLARYNDIVRERSFLSLQSDLHCAPLINSINTVALAHDVVAQVADMRDDNIESAKGAVESSALAAAMTALEIVLSIKEGTSEATNAATSWAICAASLGFAVNACAAAPQHTVAIGLNGGVLATNGGVVALNVAAAGKAGSALKLASGEQNRELLCPRELESQQSLATVKNEAQRQVNEALQAQTVARNERDANLVELNRSRVNKSAAIAALWSAIRFPQSQPPMMPSQTVSSTNIDNLVQNLIDGTEVWGSEYFKFQAAEAKKNQADDKFRQSMAEKDNYEAIARQTDLSSKGALDREIANLGEQIEALSKQDMSDERNLELGSLSNARNNKLLARSWIDSQILENEIQVLRAQIATTAPSSARDVLETSLHAKERELASNIFLAELQRARNSFNEATSQLETANTAFRQADAAYSPVRIRYSTAYSALLGVGQYLISYSNPPMTSIACLNPGGGACESIERYASLASVLETLLGPERGYYYEAYEGDTRQFLGRSVEPSLDAAYLRPATLLAKDKQLSEAIVAADERLNDAVLARDQIAAQQESVTCVITGEAVVPMNPDEAEEILTKVDQKGGTQ